jgi:hypothetical protein
MEQRRKIIIPTGTEPEETLSTPHFDTEATLSARPVVPLAEPVALPPEDAYGVQPNGASYTPAVAATATASPWKRSTLILIILAAVGLGIASGLAIGLYQSRTRASAPVVAQPSVSDETQQAARQPEPQLEQPPVVSQPETQPPQEEARIPDAPSVEDSERKPADDSDDDDDDRQASRETRRRDDKRDETRPTPPVIRDRPVVEEPDIVERDDRRGRWEERREERRERRREERREARRRQREQNEDNPLDVPRNVERARQEINRIRDIFEGRQP